MKPRSAQSGMTLIETMTVTEEGDKLRFKRITPFGPYEWVKDKKDLTGVEKAAWAQSKGAAKK